MTASHAGNKANEYSFDEPFQHQTKHPGEDLGHRTGGLFANHKAKEWSILNGWGFGSNTSFRSIKNMKSPFQMNAWKDMIVSILNFEKATSELNSNRAMTCLHTLVAFSTRNSLQ